MEVQGRHFWEEITCRYVTFLYLGGMIGKPLGSHASIYPVISYSRLTFVKCISYFRDFFQEPLERGKIQSSAKWDLTGDRHNVIISENQRSHNFIFSK